MSEEAKVQVGPFVFGPVMQEPKDPYTVKDTKFSNYFAFRYNETLLVLKRGWFWKHYLLGLLVGRFAPKHGYKYYLAPQMFHGLFRDTWDSRDLKSPSGFAEQMPDFKTEDAKHVNPQHLVKAYVSIPSKVPEYDYVLGELNYEGKIAKIHRCKKMRDETIEIVRESKILMEGCRATSMIFEIL